MTSPDDLREMTRRLRAAFDASLEQGDVPASALAAVAGCSRGASTTVLAK